jgi:tetratricopeptide (TPR) repeat protein
MEVCDTALVYNPAHHDLEQAKGVIYFIRSDYPAADSVLSRLVASGDSSALSLRYLSLAKYRQDLYDEAIPYFDRLYQLDPYNRETIMLLASCLGQTDNGDKALPLFDRAEKLMYPTEEEKYNLSLMRADTYEKKGDRQNAKKYYWDAYKLSSKNKTAMLTRLVWLCYFNRKDFETLSKEEYEQALLYNVLFMRELANRKTPIGSRQETAMMFSKSALNLYIEDLFFKDADKVRMRSPDGEISWVTRDELTQLVKLVLP